jgi:peptidoglycan/xylan/chitin deacetylase (PgdA/CDA1 family)
LVCDEFRIECFARMKAYVLGDPRRRLRLRLQRDLGHGSAALGRVDEWVRRRVRAGLGIFARPPKGPEWIIFQYYHWVLDDERKSFRRQLQLLREYGDFISMDDAVTALQSTSGIGGRYFCVTFDDGFRNGFTNAVPELKDLDVPAAFFLPTKYIGLDLDDDWDQIKSFYQQSWTKYGGFFEFLNWAECREMVEAGFTIGSHTFSHARLSSLAPTEAEVELSRSKRAIESQLGLPCHHFCCPWGMPGRDFDPTLHPDMARRLGYRSFLTTEIGVNLPGQSAFATRRISTDPDQSRLMVRYCLFPSLARSLWTHIHSGNSEYLLGPSCHSTSPSHHH